MIEQFIMRIIIIKQWKNKYTIMIALISCVMFKYKKYLDSYRQLLTPVIKAQTQLYHQKI